MSRSDLNTRSLGDVAPTLPADGEALVFDAAAGQYVPGAVSGTPGPPGPPGTSGVAAGSPFNGLCPQPDFLSGGVHSIPSAIVGSTSSTTSTNFTLLEDETYYMPFVAGWAAELTSISFVNVGNNARALISVGLYDADGTGGLPGTRLALLASVPGTTTSSVKSGTIDVTLTPGRLYWLAIAMTGWTNHAVRGIERFATHQLTYSGTTNSRSGALKASAGTLSDPATAPTTILDNSSVPLVGLLASAYSSATPASGTDFADANEFDRAKLFALSKELSYDVDGNLEQILLYDDAPPTNLIYTMDFTYDVDGNLETIDLTRESDSATFTKTFTYDVDGNLESTEIT